MKRRLALAAFSALMAALPLAGASAYPTKPITMVLGFAPGGPSDVMARVLTKKMEEYLKQPIVIDNRAGAGGTIAGGIVARAAPDGHTIMLATGSILAINVTLYANAPYDSIKDFAPISMLGVQTNVLYAHPSVPANNIKEFIAYAKANPGKLSFGSGGLWRALSKRFCAATASGRRLAASLMLARAETLAVEKHRDEDDAALCSARIEVRNIAAMELPSRLFGRTRFKSGDTVEFASTLLTHCQANRVDWRGSFRLRDER